MTPLPIDVSTATRLWVIDLKSPSGLACKVSGKPVGHLTNRGYFRVKMKSQAFQSHRVVWALYSQKDPGSMTVDHIDRNKLNNSPDNLRLAAQQGQVLNMSPQTNQHGYGVSQKGFKFRAQIGAYGKILYLGMFKTKKEAQELALEARECYHSLVASGHYS
jgi:hypothetical protein